MKVKVYGSGKMGILVQQKVLEMGHQLASIEDCDVCIEFTHPSSVLRNIKEAARCGKNIVVGTTGWHDEAIDEVEKIIKESQIGMLYSPNFSIGIHVFQQILEKASSTLVRHQRYKVSGFECHHEEKADAPSGTANHLWSTLKKNYGSSVRPFSSLRGGYFPGTHSVFFDSPEDTIELIHRSRNRDSFALGAIKAANWLLGKKGFFSFEDFMQGNNS